MSSRATSKSNHIFPGIYNYCDDWCERCSLYIFCNKEIEEPDPGKNSYSVLDKLNLILENTERIIAHFNIDYPVSLKSAAVPEKLQPDKNQMNVEELAKIDHPVSRLIDEYNFLTVQYLDDWKVKEEESFEDFLFEHTDISNLHFDMNMEEDEYYFEDIIEFYLPVLYSRVNAALYLLKETNTTFTDTQGEILHKDGFAKCAMVLINDSRNAWNNLLEQNPDSVNEIISVFVVLEKIEKEIIMFFPGCMDFRRPGFDE